MLKLDKSQIEAAADLGANPVQVFFKSVVPQSVPGIVSAFTMTFMPTMSSYVISDALSEVVIAAFEVCSHVPNHLVEHAFPVGLPKFKPVILHCGGTPFKSLSLIGQAHSTIHL